MNKKIRCFDCKHFFVTWEPSQPKGCKAYGFKSVRMPSVVVEGESGKECTLFKPKPKDVKDKGLDDDSFW